MERMISANGRTTFAIPTLDQRLATALAGAEVARLEAKQQLVLFGN
jgi:hypothetical protein